MTYFIIVSHLVYFYRHADCVLNKGKVNCAVGNSYRMHCIIVGVDVVWAVKFSVFAVSITKQANDYKHPFC